MEAMGARTPRPVWINLEHLSAESWVEGCHGLPSPHPQLSLVKYFFFPGFTRATGGLLIERGLAPARDAFQHDTAAVAAMWRSLGIVPDPAAMHVSLFCYANAALPALLDAWAADSAPIMCVVPDGAACTQLAQITGRRIEAGVHVQLKRLAIVAIPFLEIDAYDRLLWACDINFVRGEDSFVRAQLAARPLVWQAYRQAEDAHLRKASAFLDRYAAALRAEVGTPFKVFSAAWNRESADAGRQWAALRANRDALAAHARAWAADLAAGPSLASELAKFSEDRLE
jgi:uncharacterized repeat protein (TIGR03837 family)